MAKITREVKTYTITACAVTVENGNVMTEDLPVIQTENLVTEKNAEKVYKKLSGLDAKTKILVTSVTASVVKYGMDLADFMKYAKVINDNEEDVTSPADEYSAE